MSSKNPIGVFDSGYGGLTVFKDIQEKLPEYDYIYLGDNARVPYGTRSFETIYSYTKECVFKLFDMGCNLVILACNTASAKALRTIQQKDLPVGKKVLGIIRPTAETIDRYTTTNKVCILATQGTVSSESYKIEIAKFHPGIEVYQHACPMWVPLVENSEFYGDGADYFIEKDIREVLLMSSNIDTLVLACTHYPLLLPIIKKFVPKNVRILSQGQIVADSLAEYMQRHPEVDIQCSKNGKSIFYTTDNPRDFEEKAELFFGRKIQADFLKL